MQNIWKQKGMNEVVSGAKMAADKIYIFVLRSWNKKITECYVVAKSILSFKMT